MENIELEELRALLRSILSNQEAQMSEEMKDTRKRLNELHDWKIERDSADKTKKETEAKARASVTQWLMRNWPGILAVMFTAFELKKMTP